MSPERNSRPRSTRSGVGAEEEKAWVGFYRRVGNPVIAAEVMHQLESDPEMKHAHLALYLRCKESLRMQKTRQARNKRIGQFVRMLCSALFVAPALAMRKLLYHGGDLAVACLPEVVNEPATPRVRRLSKEPEFVQAHAQFDDQTAAQTDAASSGAKTA